MNTYFDKRYRRGNQTWTIQRYWQHKVHKTKTNKAKTIQRYWQHKVHKTKTNKIKTPLYANKHK